MSFWSNLFAGKEIADLKARVELAEKKVVELNHENDDLKNQIAEFDSVQNTEDRSSITFEISEELDVVIKSRVNKNIIPTLVDQNYISASNTEDHTAIQIAFILVAADATDQIIRGIEDYAHESNS